MKKLVVSLVSAVALAVVGMAAAETITSTDAPEQIFSNTAAGLYAAGSLGYGDVFATASSNGANSTSTGALAWDTLIGYQFNPNIALETSYISFGSATLNYASVGSIKASLAGFGADAKGIYSFNNRVDVFLTAGILRLTQTFSSNIYSSDISAWTPDLSMGIAYKVTKNIAVTAKDVYAFQNSSNNIPQANALLAGVSYKINI